MKIEGYWNTESNWYPEYPMPVHSDTEHPDKARILRRLEMAETAAKEIAYRGFSRCRCCGLVPNGSREFELKGWRWPQGFRHYIEVHNVTPSAAFMAFLGI